MSKVRWLYIFFIDGEAGTERLHTYLFAELTSKPSSEAWELELWFSTLDHLSIHFSRICILQNLEYILVLFTYRECNNCTYAFMTSPWSELWCVWYWVHLFRNKTPRNRIIFENCKSFCSVLLEYYWNNYVFSRFKNPILLAFTPIFNFTS